MRTLLISLMLLAGCVSLPDTNLQPEVLPHQPFGPDYQFAISSFYHDTRVASSMSNTVIDSYSATSNNE